MNITCDLAPACEAQAMDLGDDHVSEVHARARGWHVWSGYTEGGEYRVVRLCPLHVDAGRRKLPPAPAPLPGQESLQLEISFDWDET